MAADPLTPSPRVAKIANVLTIAGTDPVGGAGIMADIKSISALGAYGLAVVTAVVAQNTQRVGSIDVLAPDLVREQIDMVFDDVAVDAVKIGMVGNAQIAEVIAERLQHYRARHIVFDPVMVASSGDQLVADEALGFMRDILLPLCELVTPNLSEAGLLLNVPPAQSLSEMRAQLPALYRLGAEHVLLKGGHMADAAQSIDLLFGAAGEKVFSAPRLVTRHGRGTGCSLSSAIAALLPRYEMGQAVGRAKAFLQGALAASDDLNVGQGAGPLHHFHALWK